MRKTLQALALAAGLSASQAGLAALEFDLNFEFSGGADPSGSVLATFQQMAANTVQLTVDLTGLSGTEFISGFYFNYNPTGSVALSSLSFSGRDPHLSVQFCEKAPPCHITYLPSRFEGSSGSTTLSRSASVSVIACCG